MSPSVPTLASVVRSGCPYSDFVVFWASWNALHRPDLRGLGPTRLHVVALAAHASITERVVVYQCPSVLSDIPTTGMTLLEWKTFAAACDPARVGAQVCLVCDMEFYGAEATAWVRRYLAYSREPIEVYVAEMVDWFAHVLARLRLHSTVFPSVRLEEVPVTATTLPMLEKTSAPPTVVGEIDDIDV